MGLSNYDETRPIIQGAVIVAANGTANQQVAYISDGQGRIDTLMVINGDTIAHVCYLVHNIGGIMHLLGSYSVPAQQGLGGTPALDLLALCLPATQVGLLLNSTTSIMVFLAVPCGGANAVHVTASGGYL